MAETKWYTINVAFYGDSLVKVDNLFDRLMRRQADDGLGVRPPWKACDKHDLIHMFRIQKRGSCVYQFESEPAPALANLFLIGRRFNVSFEAKWWESSKPMCGMATFHPYAPDVMMVYDGSDINLQEFGPNINFESNDLVWNALEKTFACGIFKKQIFNEG